MRGLSNSQKRLTRPGQTGLEYVLLVTGATIVILGMSVYGKRALAGRLKAGIDQASGQEQFSPRWSNYTATTISVSRVRSEILPNGESTSYLEPIKVGDKTVNASVRRTVGKIDNFENADNPKIYDAVGAHASSHDDFSGKKLSEEGLFDQ